MEGHKVQHMMVSGETSKHGNLYSTYICIYVCERVDKRKYIHIYICIILL